MNVPGRAPGLVTPLPFVGWVQLAPRPDDPQRVRILTDDDALLDQLSAAYEPWGSPIGEEVEHEQLVEYSISLHRRAGAGPRRLPHLTRNGAVVARSRTVGDLVRWLDVALAGPHAGADASSVPVSELVAVVAAGRACLVSGATFDGGTIAEIEAQGLVVIGQGLVELDVADPARCAVSARCGLAGDRLSGALGDDPIRVSGELVAVAWSASDAAADESRGASVVRLVQRAIRAGARVDQRTLNGLESASRLVVAELLVPGSRLKARAQVMNVLRSAGLVPA